MMYCENCGTEISKEAYVCPKCGVKVKNDNTSEDTPNIGLNILSLFFPLVGIILYFTWKKDTPKKAKGVLTFALIGWAIKYYFNHPILTRVTKKLLSFILH